MELQQIYERLFSHDSRLQSDALVQAEANLFSPMASSFETRAIRADQDEGLRAWRG
jgi:hypothetical protein